jgi:hypothetical protein
MHGDECFAELSERSKWRPTLIICLFLTVVVNLCYQTKGLPFPNIDSTIQLCGLLIIIQFIDGLCTRLSKATLSYTEHLITTYGATVLEPTGSSLWVR